MKIHMVKKGDTLYEIAKKHHIDLDVLIAANPQLADPNVLDVGMKVKIPNAPKPIAPPSAILYEHKVVQGDSLWKLGKAWGIPLADMIAANPQLKNPNILLTGETVLIPKAKSPEPHVAHQPEVTAPQVPSYEPAPIAAEPPAGVPVLPQIPLTDIPPVPEIELPGGDQPAQMHDAHSAIPFQAEPALPMAPQAPDFAPPHQNLFEQFQVPATEVGGMNLHLSGAQYNVWMEPELPAYPDHMGGHELAAMSYPPQHQYPMTGGDCGCGCGGSDPFLSQVPWNEQAMAYQTEGVPGMQHYGMEQDIMQQHSMHHYGMPAAPYQHYGQGFDPFDAGFGHQRADAPPAPYGYPYAPLEEFADPAEENQAAAPSRNAKESVKKAAVSQTESVRGSQAASSAKRPKKKKLTPAQAAIQSLLKRHSRRSSADKGRSSGTGMPWLG